MVEYEKLIGVELKSHSGAGGHLQEARHAGDQQMAAAIEGYMRRRPHGLHQTHACRDALLAEVAAPDGLDLYQLVAEHPDIDPAMRRPGTEPEPGPGPTLPDGGSFS